ncbi:MAG TPA: SBBP repeat-containing protein [Bryobacteraceae bacterium]|nr:SBBP repeat-containing protein [Bryobacteraceae bacterium]
MKSTRSVLFFILVGAPCLAAASVAPGSLARLPLTFESRGDTMLAREGGMQITLAPGAIATTIAQRGNDSAATTVISTLRGADPRIRPEGIDPLQARATYLQGNDRSQWRAGVPLFQRAIYRGIYPGIDLVFYGSGRDIEYDFVIQPGGDPRAIALDVSGTSAMRLLPEGALAIETDAGELRWHKPLVYQMSAGVRREIPGHFVRHGRRISFALAAYDHSRTLIIDPTLSYSTYFGGSAEEGLRGIAVDSAGNTYITGFSFSNNLPVTSGSFQTAYHGSSGNTYLAGDVFVAKLTAAGALAYVTYVGGAQDELGIAIAVDSAGSAYVTGYTDSTNFPTVAGSFQTKFQGSGGNKWYGPLGDAFVFKLNAAGSALVYSTYLGGTMDDRGTSIAVDSAGNAYVGGVTLSTNFPVLNAYQSTFKGGGGSKPFCCGDPSPFLSEGDGFITKLNPAGSALVYSTYFGGALDDAITSLAVDSAGDVYFAGFTLSHDFPVLNAYQSKFAGAASIEVQPVYTMGDGFVAKLNSTGGLAYSTYFGGSSDDAIMGLAIDGTGAAYVTGYTSSSDFPVSKNAAQPAFAGPATLTLPRSFVWGDAFAAKISPSGNSLVYSTFLGGSADDAGLAISVDPSGNAYVGGFANSTNFPVTAGALQSKFAGGGGTPGFLAMDPTGDGFLTQINPDGSKLLYSTYFGGRFDDSVSSVTLDAQGNVYLGGVTVSPDLAVTSNAAQHNFGGASDSEITGDAFVAKIAGLSTAAGPVISAVVNGASGIPGFAPNAWMTLAGTNLSTTTNTWTITNGHLPTSLDGVQVSVGGQPAYVYYVSPTQINVVAPNVTPGPTQVTVTNNLGTSQTFAATSGTYSPAFFLWPGNYAVATHQDFSLAIKNGVFSGITTTPAKPGDVIILWGTGFGPTTPAAPVGELVPSDATYSAASPVSVNIGGMKATVYGAALAPGFAALYQVAIQVPTTLANGDHVVVTSVGGVNPPSTTMLTVQK